jgi:hypothetical protein
LGTYPDYAVSSFVYRQFATMTSNYPYYLLWSGGINLGDTPGVFTESEFVGLLVQIPFRITSSTIEAITILLLTTDVEIFQDANGNRLVHNVYLNWQPGQPFPTPVGTIDDEELFPGRPEIHQLNIPAERFQPQVQGNHTLTIHVNPNVAAGLKDDFVLKNIQISDNVGARIGWS